MTATAGDDLGDLVHVGILWVDSRGEAYVVEASPTRGVSITTLREFCDGESGVVKRPGFPFSPQNVMERAFSFLGQPYDWYYLPDNGMMYCSELVYESYLDGEGNHLFIAQPMNFRAPDGTMPRFWEELYKKLGVDVPEGQPGTNPNELSRDERLIEICRY